MTKFFVGSYATSPNLYALEHPGEAGIAYSADAEANFYDGLSDIELCRGLEVQLHFDGSMHCFDEAVFLATYARPKWEAVLTCIGGTMGRVGKSAAYGLASNDEAGRLEAIEFARVALAAVSRWNGRGHGAGKCIAVEIHSAPNNTMHGASSSAEALTQSLVELMSWDWEGASLVVEHCDAPAPADAPHPASKGFLSIADEIKAIEAANASGSSKNGAVGIGINWARSVLEVRNVANVVTHIEAAKAKGVLSGIMFSG